MRYRKNNILCLMGVRKLDISLKKVFWAVFGFTNLYTTTIILDIKIW